MENRGETNAIGKPLQFWLNFIQALTSFIEEDNSYYKEIFMKYSTIDPVQIAAIKLWEELLEDLIEFLEYEVDKKTRTWTDITQFMVLQVKVKGLFDKLLEEYDIEENELAGYAPYFLQFTKEYLDTFDTQVSSFTKESIKINLLKNKRLRIPLISYKSYDMNLINLKFLKRVHFYPTKMRVSHWTMTTIPIASFLMHRLIYSLIYPSEQMMS